MENSEALGLGSLESKAASLGIPWRMSSRLKPNDSNSD